MIELVLDVLEDLGLDVETYHLAPQLEEGDLSLSACGVAARRYYSDPRDLLAMPVPKCPACVTAARGVAMEQQSPKDSIALDPTISALKKGDEIAKHMKDCKVCVIDLTTRQSLRACEEGKKLLWGSIEVTHDEKESPVAASLRAELRKILDKPLTVQRLRKVGRVVTASIKMLQATAEGIDNLLPPPPSMGRTMGGPSSPDEVDLAEEAPAQPAVPGIGLGSYMSGPNYGASYASAPALETFGSNSFREIAAMAMRVLEKKNEPKPPTAVDKAEEVKLLTETLAEAKQANLGDDVVKRIEKKLATALDPESEIKTISPRSVVVSEPAPLSEYVSAIGKPGAQACLCIPPCDCPKQPEPATMKTGDETF